MISHIANRKAFFLVSGKGICICLRKEEMKQIEASVTVEAVCCIPLFFYAAVTLIWMLEIRTVQTTIRCGMQEAGKKQAEELYKIPLVYTGALEAEIVRAVGGERLDRSCIVGGSDGLECGKSYVIPGSGILEMKVQYRVRLPFPVFAVPPMEYQETMRIKGWTGYVRQDFLNTDSQEIVYITETGVVYHRDYHCTYLEPSIKMVSGESLDALRNADQGRYYPCERCMKRTEAGSVVYITDYGDRYHGTLSCSGIKRKIYAVPISEAKGKGACSKCGK